MTTAEMTVAPITDADFLTFQTDMQAAFQTSTPLLADQEADDEIILPAQDIWEAYQRPDSISYKAVVQGQIVGGAIITLDKQRAHGELALLYVNSTNQGQGYGLALWQQIEALHPDIKTWETLVLYLEHRNLHFYLNLCGFQAVEFYNSRHLAPDGNPDNNDLLRLIKRV